MVILYSVVTYPIVGPWLGIFTGPRLMSEELSPPLGESVKGFPGSKGEPDFGPPPADDTARAGGAAAGALAGATK